MARQNSGEQRRRSKSVVSEFEGTLLKDPDPFSYFMLVAFEASGLIRFTLLLILWPIIRLLEVLRLEEVGFRVMVFVTVVGVKVSEIEAVARAVLPKFYMDDVDIEAWRFFSSKDKRVVVSKWPRVMVERFAKEHLRADGVVGEELEVNRFGYANGFLKEGGSWPDRVREMVKDDQPDLGLGRKTSASFFLTSCKEILHPPFVVDGKYDSQLVHPNPVIFHDGRLVRRPTPSTSFLILLWLPIAILLAAFRICFGVLLPVWAISYTSGLFGGGIVVRGRPSARASEMNDGVLFVCTHRTLMDPVILAVVLGRKIPAVTYSISRLSEILSPIPTIRLTRDRRVDANRIKQELTKGDLVVCPEGTTCREPFLLRFSALFAELTDRIVPVAMNYRVSFFHATTARGWKAMDPIFFFMNPRPLYEVTFLNQLPMEMTCSAGKDPYDVANYVQRTLAGALGFECTNFTRKDKYRILANSDGTVSSTTSYLDHLRKLAGAFIN